MTTSLPYPLVSAEWLQQHLGSSTLCVLDASYFLPTVDRDADEEFLQAHIPGAIRFDIDQIKDPDPSLPHMLPSTSQFDEATREMGIGADSQIVVYDSLGLFSAARVWWMFRYFGHQQVSVLDGGLLAWKALGGQIQTGQAKPGHHSVIPLKSMADSASVVCAQALSEEIQNMACQVIDARSRERFQGRAPELRKDLRSGHIPSSLNLHYASLLEPDTGKFRSKAALAAAFDALPLAAKPLVVSCGSGVTACILALALEILGRPQPRLYDGSWTEWGSRPELPVELG